MSGEDTEHTPIKIDPENEQREGSTVDPSLQSYLLGMMVRVTKIQNTPLPKCLFTEDIIHEVFHESMSHKHQITNVDIFNEYECVIEIAPPVTYSVLSMKFQRLMRWLGIEVQVFCILAEANVLRKIKRERQDRARNRTPVQDPVP